MTNWYSLRGNLEHHNSKSCRGVCREGIRSTKVQMSEKEVRRGQTDTGEGSYGFSGEVKIVKQG